MIKNLPPAYFAFVMATGIVSIAAELQGFHAAAVGFFFVAASGYLVLWNWGQSYFIAFWREGGTWIRGIYSVNTIKYD